MAMETIACQICGKKMTNLNNRHLSQHNITILEYKKQYPDAQTMTDTFKSKLQDRSKKANENRKGISRTPQEIEAIKLGIASKSERIAHNKGVPMSDEQKQKLSARHREDFASGKRTPANLGKDVSQEVRDKISKTLTGRKPDPSAARRAVQTKRDRGYDMAFWKGKTHSTETKHKISIKSREIAQEKRAVRRQHMFEKIDDSNLLILNTIDSEIFELKCKICNYEFTRTPQMFQPSKWHNRVCDQCFPISPVSNSETIVADYIENFGVKIVRSDMELITPLEIDILCHDLKIGVEYCGIYWHSELEGKSRWYHQYKHDIMKERGYRLITIFEDEWINRRPIVESMLRNTFGVAQQKIAARKCQVRKIESSEGRAFIETNHIQGKGRANVYYGLYYEDELVSVMSFSNSEKSRNSVGWDMNRFCSKLGVNVMGGAGKLFSAFIKEYDPDKVVSYADLRYGTGAVYGHLGFEFVGQTVPNYWYFRSNELKRYHRFGLRKNKDDVQSLTEWENRQLQGWNRIWDCGHAKWVWNK